jgi:D-xylono/L-arabinono-1,4-lactonase
MERVTPRLQIVADYGCYIGENPLWHPLEQKIYWCDIATGRLFRFDPISGEHENCYEGDVIGGFTIQRDGSLLLFMAEGAIRTWRSGEVTTIVEGIEEECGSRFNDVIADPCGRVFCGTTPTANRAGRLYRLDRDGTLSVAVEGIGRSNGLAFSRDRLHLYYTDSNAREIYLFDYDERSGALANRRIFAATSESDGVPDGATLDASGCLWSAQWDGGCVIRYAADGEEERRVVFPVRKISSLTFGGSDYSDIYVTSAGGDDKTNEGAHAGCLFRLNLGIQGVPEYFSRIGRQG